MKLGIGGDIATIRVDAEGRGRVTPGNGISDLPRDCDRPNPGQGIGKISEAFAEVDRRRVGVELIGAHAVRTCTAPFDAEADRHHELMFDILEQPVFERGLEVLETVGSRARRIDRAEKGVGRAERDRKILGDALGKLTGDIALANRRVVARLEAVDGRQRQFVVDAGIVDPERRREKSIADDLVRKRWCEREERGGKAPQARARRTDEHWITPQVLTCSK